jgi:DNA replication and repair protein RecF
LAALGTRVMRRRSRGLARLAPVAAQWHQAISGQTEQLQVDYQPNVPLDSDDPTAIQGAFLAKIQQRAIAERHQHTSLVGPHRDDIAFTINDTPARQYGSQGQQRTLVLALKLAELKLIESVVGEPPLLLLDDVLAELDLNRQNQLLDAIQDRFQTLITTTHLGSFDAQWLKASQVLTVQAGQITT